MSRPQPASPAKLLVSIFAREEVFIEKAANRLANVLGPIDFYSPVLPFDKTNYYEPEFGPQLVRRFISFSRLIPQESIVAIKHLAWKIEKDFSLEGKRQVNIDPGYILLERLVLVTFKNYTHRIYLGQGVYAEVTLLFQRHRFVPLPWTYPDYADPKALEFFLSLRQRFKEQLKEWQRRHAER